ncbi:MAG: PEP-CTERM sorting domain-containing protein [Akkermansiaceae bacterium]
MNIKTPLIIATLLGVASSSQAAVSLQIDFDSTTVGTYSGNDAPAAIADTVWNGNANADVFSGLLYGDGTAALGVTLELGATDENASGTVLDFTGNDARGPSQNTDIQGGIYDSDLTDDWVFDRNNADIGARITGLAVGVYDVYAITKEPNELTRTYDVGIGVFTAANGNSISSASTELTTTAIGDATGTTTWVNGLNYALTRVTITDTTDYIAVVVDPTNERFATLGGLQIVAVPEPSSTALLGLGTLGFILRRRR